MNLITKAEDDFDNFEYIVYRKDRELNQRKQVQKYKQKLKDN